MQEMMKKRAAELLSGGKVNRVIGWKTGDFVYDVTPAVFETAEEIENDFVYTAFCGNNLSKYLVKEARKPGVTLVFLKPCDSYSFAQLLKEHRVKRESVYAVAVECFGKADIDRIKERGVKGVTGISEENGTLHISAVYGIRTSRFTRSCLKNALPAKRRSTRSMTRSSVKRARPLPTATDSAR